MKNLKLNLGCGLNKIDGFVNIDSEPSVKPDILCDFLKKRIPFKNSTVDEVILFHTIEHLPKRSHEFILSEVWRVLKPSGIFLVSYPEFSKCVKNWLTNKQGQKEFWEATIYGRQLFPSDYHVAIMHTPDFIDTLRSQGFVNVKHKPEATQPHNTIVKCAKGIKLPTYSDLIENDMNTMRLKKV